jgi:hypothetical protein
MKTFDIKQLVLKVLDTLPKPYTEHVIDEVFFAIEQSPKWHSEYERLCATFGKAVTNNWGGRWIGKALDKVGKRQVPSKRSRLITSYSLLDTDAE